MIADASFAMVTFPPLPCVKMTFCPVRLWTKYTFCASFGRTVIVCAEESGPVMRSRLYCPFDREPSAVDRLDDVPARVRARTPFRAASRMSLFTLTVSPQVPDCSPSAGFSIPVLRVYELGIGPPYAATVTQLGS